MSGFPQVGSLQEQRPLSVLPAGGAFADDNFVGNYRKYCRMSVLLTVFGNGAGGNDVEFQLQYAFDPLATLFVYNDATTDNSSPPFLVQNLYRVAASSGQFARFVVPIKSPGGLPYFRVNARETFDIATPASVGIEWVPTTCC